jgi:hypothetical protein
MGRDIRVRREWNTLLPVDMPAESYGECRDSRICKNYRLVVLGEGLCVSCWDRSAWDRGTRIP